MEADQQVSRHYCLSCTSFTVKERIRAHPRLVSLLVIISRNHTHHTLVQRGLSSPTAVRTPQAQHGTHKVLPLPALPVEHSALSKLLQYPLHPIRPHDRHPAAANLQLYPDQSGPPADRPLRHRNVHNAVVDLWSNAAEASIVQEWA